MLAIATRANAVANPCSSFTVGNTLRVAAENTRFYLVSALSGEKKGGCKPSTVGWQLF